MAEDSGSGDFWAGFLVGALVGAAAALLFAPQSGEETRTYIRDKGIELGQRADELTLEARKRAEGLQVQAKERAGDLQGRVKQAVEEGKAAAATKKEELLTQLEAGEVTDDTPAEA
jgi:gas vesicle protein